MTHYGFGDYEIDKEEIPLCKAMFIENFPGSRFIRSYFSESNTSQERYYNIEAERENGDRDVFKFCLNFNEEEELIELLMLDYVYNEIDCKEIAFRRG